MKETSKTADSNSLNQTTETFDTQKAWATPELRILPVPDKTQGGAQKSTFE